MAEPIKGYYKRSPFSFYLELKDLQVTPKISTSHVDTHLCCSVRREKGPMARTLLVNAVTQNHLDVK